MLERPDLDDVALTGALREGFRLGVERLEFMPRGNDSGAWTYRVTDRDGRDWFVKVRRTANLAAVEVPRFLRWHGLPEIVAAEPTSTGEPWLDVGPWKVLVYRFVDEPRAMDIGLDADGWRRLGDFAARLHAFRLPAALETYLQRETFQPKSTDLARTIAAMVAGGRRDEPTSDDDMTRRVIATWARHRGVLEHLVARADELSAQIRARRSANRKASGFAVCHADLHTGNILVTSAGGLHVIDWDEVMLAPPERDLMFVRDSVVAGSVSDEEATAFETAYGSRSPDPILIAYYRIDWAVQDISDFARRVVLDPDLGLRTRARALELFEGQFEPGGEVEWALAGDAAIPRGSMSPRTP